MSLKVTPASLQNSIADLPRLDFYALFETHRLSWKGTQSFYAETIHNTRTSYLRLVYN